MTKPSVLFVCLGNICRSPMAEAALRKEAAARGLEIHINSAGTGDWHIGKQPDARAQAETLRHGMDISSLRARQATEDDFRNFTHIIALDHENLSSLKCIQPGDATTRLSMAFDHVDGMRGQSVADPYFGESDGFAKTWYEVSLVAAALADRLAKDLVKD